MLFRFKAALALAAYALPLAAQSSARPTVTAKTNAVRPVPAALRPYTSCKLPGGPDLLQTTPLPQAPMTRAAQTLTGPKKVTIADGVFAAFGFSPGTPFANVKIEQLPAASYASEKADLISEFDKINATGEDTKRNYDLKPTLNGFEIYGFDRTALDGNVLGIYLFFENAHHIATTAYLLNGTAGQRSFKTVQEYNGLREGFLNAYTLCVRKALGGVASPKPAAKPASKAVAHPARHR